MIRMSQLRRLVVMALVGLSLGCLNQVCSAIGCLEGLNIWLEGGFDPDKPYTIELSRPMPGGGQVPVMSCVRTMPLSSGTQMTCTSSLRFVADPHHIQILDQSITKLRVVISAEGAVISQRDFDIKFPRQEINGRGCGWCTSASITIDEPARPVWGAQGQSVRYGLCGSDALGMTGFAATREQFSAEQNQLLGQMRPVPSPGPSCPGAGMDCFMEVIYRDGRVAGWRAGQGDGTCGAGANLRDQLVLFSTFEPFRVSLGCRYSTELTAAAQAAAASGAPIPALEPSEICRHGIIATAARAAQVGLVVPAAELARPRVIELYGCNRSVGSGPLTLELFDPTGTTLLARGTDRSDLSGAPCHVLEHTFSSAGTFVLKLLAHESYFTGTVFLSYH
jgi:hypothetical protein